MKSIDAGICSEISVSDGGFLHICALQVGHTDDHHECACGSLMYKDEIDCVSSKEWVKEYQNHVSSFEESMEKLENLEE